MCIIWFSFMPLRQIIIDNVKESISNNRMFAVLRRHPIMSICFDLNGVL